MGRKYGTSHIKKSDRVITSLSLVTNEEFYIDRVNSHLLRTDAALVTSTLYSLPDLVI